MLGSLFGLQLGSLFGLQRMRLCMVQLLFVNLLNIVLNFIFVLGQVSRAGVCLCRVGRAGADGRGSGANDARLSVRKDKWAGLVLMVGSCLCWETAGQINQR